MCFTEKISYFTFFEPWWTMLHFLVISCQFVCYFSLVFLFCEINNTIIHHVKFILYIIAKGLLLVCKNLGFFWLSSFWLMLRHVFSGGVRSGRFPKVNQIIHHAPWNEFVQSGFSLGRTTYRYPRPTKQERTVILPWKIARKKRKTS